MDKFPAHNREFLVPVTRFCIEELNSFLDQMRNFCTSNTLPSSNAALLRYLLHPFEYTLADTCPMANIISSSARSYDVHRLRSWKLSNSEVPWVNSEPVICEGVLSAQQMFLTPAYFMQTFGREEVDLIDCESGVSKEGKLEEILKLFDSAERPRDPVWKVKVCSSLLDLNPRYLDCQDWPSQATFRGGKFAEIYEEFEDCLPFPHLTRLNGRDNLAAHFPDDAGLPPDLGNDMSSTSCSLINAAAMV